MAKGKFTVIESLRDLPHAPMESFAEFQGELKTLSPSDYKKLATAFVSGLVDSMNWIESNQQEAGEIIEKYTGIPAYAIGDYHFTGNGRINTNDIQVWYDYLLGRGDITADWLELGSVSTNKYNITEN